MWTREIPKKSGYYWAYSAKLNTIDLVELSVHGKSINVWLCGVNTPVQYKELKNFHWSDQIVEPDSPIGNS